METEIVFLVRESPEGGYEASASGHAIFTEADTLEELKAIVMMLSTVTLMKTNDRELFAFILLTGQI